MFNKRIKNNDAVNRVWVGQLITPGNYYLVQAFEDIRWSHDAQLIVDVVLGNAIVNDGITDITDVNDAINYLKNNASPVVKRIETFTGIADGSIVTVPTLVPLRYFTLSVTTTGVITAWSVTLEGSLDGISFTTIAKHDNLTKSGQTVFPGVNVTPCLYFRIRCLSITLGLGTNIVATAIGSP